jgi:hypothetical protein
MLSLPFDFLLWMLLLQGNFISERISTFPLPPFVSSYSSRTGLLPAHHSWAYLTCHQLLSEMVCCVVGHLFLLELYFLLFFIMGVPSLRTLPLMVGLTCCWLLSGVGCAWWECFVFSLLPSFPLFRDTTPPRCSVTCLIRLLLGKPSP